MCVTTPDPCGGKKSPWKVYKKNRKLLWESSQAQHYFAFWKLYFFLTNSFWAGLMSEHFMALEQLMVTYLDDYLHLAARKPSGNLYLGLGHYFCCCYPKRYFLTSCPMEWRWKLVWLLKGVNKKSRKGTILSTWLGISTRRETISI